jgi:hypothetical protein
MQLFRSKRGRYVLAPNDIPIGQADSTRSCAHGEFDDDTATVQSTLGYMLGKARVKAQFKFSASAPAARERRQALA